MDTALPDDFERLLQLFSDDDVAPVGFVLRHALRRAESAEIVAAVFCEIADEIPVRNRFDAVDAVAIHMKIAHPAFEGQEMEMPRWSKGPVLSRERIVGRYGFDVAVQAAAEILTSLTRP